MAHDQLRISHEYHEGGNDGLVGNIQKLIERFRPSLRALNRMPLYGLFLTLLASTCDSERVDVSQKDPDVTLKALPNGGTEAKKNAMLPEYPVSKQLVVIINGDPGDSKDKRHVKNVPAAISALQPRGFHEFYVAADQTIDPKGIQLKQLPGSKQGVDDLFEALKAQGVLKKDALAFFYVTGHGMMKDKEACIARENARLGTGKNMGATKGGGNDSGPAQGSSTGSTSGAGTSGAMGSTGATTGGNSGANAGGNAGGASGATGSGNK